MREMMDTILMLCRLDPAWGMAFVSALLAVPVIVTGAAGAFFPEDVDELEEGAA